MTIMADSFAHIAGEKWDEAADVVINEIQAETGISDRLPKLLNGRCGSKRRVLAKLREKERLNRGLLRLPSI